MSTPSPFTPEQEARIREIIAETADRAQRFDFSGPLLTPDFLASVAEVASASSTPERQSDLAPVAMRDRNGRRYSEWRKPDGSVATRAEVGAFLSPSGQPTRTPSLIRRALAAVRRRLNPAGASNA